MKPTEADIQAELIEGWEISYRQIADDGKVLVVDVRDIGTNLKFSMFGPEKQNDFDVMFPDGSWLMNQEYQNFLSCNCDLSNAYQHYDPEEWQRIITMCESIVRLITGEQVEQTLEEGKPTYEELEAQFNKLKADYQELDDEFEETHKRHCQARKAMERYQAEFLDMRRDRDRLATNYQRECERAAGLQERLEKAEAENASLLDKFGPIDQAEQQVAEVETRFQKLAKKAERIADIMIQLNEEIL